ncbi:MAG: MFS transporter [Acidimicrobiia bacterium]|nr:MFS transporter [Acidimicrobiia bacterium]
MTDTLKQTRRVFLSITFLRWVGPGLVVPILVLALTSHGLDLAQVGIVFAVYGGTTVLFELPTGGLADSIGRKPVLAMAGALFITFDVLFLVGTTLPVFMVAAFIGGAGRALSSGPLESWYVDRARSIDPALVLRKDLSTAGVLAGVALTCGALASVGLANLPPGSIAGLSNVLVSVLGAVVADTVFVVTVLLAIREPERQHTRIRTVFGDVPSVVGDGIRVARSQHTIRLLLGTTFGVAVAAVSIETLWQPRYADLLGGPEEAAKIAGLVVAGFAFASVIGSALAQRVPKRFVGAPGPSAATALTLAAIGLVGMAAAGSPWLLTGLLLAVYVCLAFSDVLRQEMLHEWVPGNRRTTIVSVDSLAGQLGNVGASLILVPIAGATSISTGWLLGAGIMFAAALVVSLARMPTDDERQEIPTGVVVNAT